jgi:hypothetical protein
MSRFLHQVCFHESLFTQSLLIEFRYFDFFTKLSSDTADKLVNWCR